jgi:hypothetical protein
MRVPKVGYLYLHAVYVHLQSTKPKKDNNNNNVYFTFVSLIITSYHIISYYHSTYINIIISYITCLLLNLINLRFTYYYSRHYNPMFNIYYYFK